MTTEQTTTEQGAPFAPCSPFALLALCGEQGNAFALLICTEQGKGIALCGAPFALCGEQTTTEQTTEQGAPCSPFVRPLWRALLALCAPFALLALRPARPLWRALLALCGEQITTEQGAPFAPFAHNLSLLKVNLSSQSEFEKSRFEFSK
jgi:hypothetical protein